MLCLVVTFSCVAVNNLDLIFFSRRLTGLLLFFAICSICIMPVFVLANWNLLMDGFDYHVESFEVIRRADTICILFFNIFTCLGISYIFNNFLYPSHFPNLYDSVIRKIDSLGDSYLPPNLVDIGNRRIYNESTFNHSIGSIIHMLFESSASSMDTVIKKIINPPETKEYYPSISFSILTKSAKFWKTFDPANGYLSFSISGT